MPRVPYRVLYSNDTTHHQTCTSPYHAKGAPFSIELFDAGVDEVGPVDAHLLQPGLGWVPWWNSTHYPFAEHVRFMREQFGMTPDQSGFAQYMADGGDLVGRFVARCAKVGTAPFVSFRLNDGHGFDLVYGERRRLPDWAWHVVTPIHLEHPEWRVGTNLGSWNERVLNWAIPAVRDHKLAFIRELIERYPLAGFELDFMRHISFFRLDETPPEERVRIMAGFIGEVRAILDRQGGPRRALCVRIPAWIATHPPLGIDVRRFVDAGVDMVNCSGYFHWEQTTDAPAIRRLVPDASVYAEITHATNFAVVPGVKDSGAGANNQAMRRSSPHQIRTAAHLAYARGLDGVSFFNFPYYREHHAFGSAQEPPFEVLQRLADRDGLARQPLHYFRGRVWNEPRLPDRPLAPDRTVAPGATLRVPIDIAPPAGGFTRPARMRLQAAEPLQDGRWEASINGAALPASAEVGEPLPAYGPDLLGKPEAYRAWTIAPGLLRDGLNDLEFTHVAGAKPAAVVWVDVALT